MGDTPEADRRPFSVPRSRWHAWLVAVLAVLATPAGAASVTYPWAAAARSLAPPGWRAGTVIGFDPVARTGILAVFPEGDEDPASPGKALQVILGPDGRPIPGSAVLRDRKPTEHRYFADGRTEFVDDAFVPKPNLPAGVTPCSVGAWSNDKDPRGLNLRTLPSKTGKIVGRLPGPRKGMGYGIEFRIVGFKDGWFLIEDAEDPDYDQTAPKGETIFKGRGWVAGNLVASSIATGPGLMANPHYDAALLLDLSGTVDGVSYGTDSVPIRKMLACNGSWTKVEVEDPPTKRRHIGWVARLCSNQVTTCP